MNSRRSYLLFAHYLGILLLLSACAGAPYNSADVSSVPFQERAETQVSGLVEVTAAVPGPEETRALFDLTL